MTTQIKFVQWNKVPGYVGVEVNQYGEVRHISTQKMFRVYDCGSGYPAVTVTEITGRRVMCRVHVLVMLAFKGERPEGYHVDHKNGNKLDNSLSNLRYVTPSVNNRNRSCNVFVEYNGQQVLLIEALEDMFGADRVSTKYRMPGSKLYRRISAAIRKGKSFDVAIQKELSKHGWPTGEAE